MVKGAMDFVFPPLCLGCGRFNESTIPVCPGCLAAIDRFSDPICLRCLRPNVSTDTCPVCGKDWLPLFAYGEYVAPLRAVSYTHLRAHET